MRIDNENLFSDAQLVTTGSENGIISTNKIDLAIAGRDIGAGEDIKIAVGIQTTMAGPSSDVLKVELVTDDNADFSTPTVIQILGEFPTNSVAGTRRVWKLTPSASYERYIALRYTSVDHALTAGKVDAFLAKDADLQKNYASGYSIKAG